MKLKGNYDSGTSYNVGDVVKYTNDVVYILQYPAKSGTPPVDTRYWGQADQTLQDAARLVIDALEIESGNNQQIAPNISDDAIILKSSSEGSTKEFIITVDDDGELTATELEE